VGDRERDPVRYLVDIFASLWSIMKGLRVTFINWFSRPRVTVQYPFRGRLTPGPRYRGMFIIRRDPSRPGGTMCTACLKCAEACPANVFTIIPEGQGRMRHPKVFDMDLSRCLYCHLCVEACPFDCLAQTEEYENAVYDRRDFIATIELLHAPDRPPGFTHKELLSLQEAQRQAEKETEPVEA
jgi:NADH-quinone oxidoreductase subunit I